MTPTETAGGDVDLSHSRTDGAKTRMAIRVADKMQDAFDTEMIDNDLGVSNYRARKFVEAVHDLHHESVQHSHPTQVAHEVGRQTQRLVDMLDEMDADMAEVKQTVERLGRLLGPVGHVQQWMIEEFGDTLPRECTFGDSPDRGCAKFAVESIIPPTATLERAYYEDGQTHFRVVSR